METKEFKDLLEELKVTYRNISKDPEPRRTNLEIIRSKLIIVNNFKRDYGVIKGKFNSAGYKPEIIGQAKEFVAQIDRHFEAIFKILKDRENVCQTKQSEFKEENKYTQSISSNSECLVQVNIMAEKFDLRTAASLLPVMNGTENVTRQLIDGIDLYDSLLDASGKTSLTNYVLKTRISQNAKIRLANSYTSNQNLIRDIKTHFLTKKAASTLSVQLSTIRQGNRSIEDFGRKIEDLLSELTIAQADGNEEALNVLSGVNEKLAINSFANGLNSADVRTIVKARNYAKLGEAIRGAKDEDSTKRESTQQIFNMRNREIRGFTHGNSRGNPGKKFYNNRNGSNNHFTHYGNNRNNNNNYQFRGNSRPFNRSGYTSNNNKFQNRGSFSNRNSRGNQKTYYIGESENSFQGNNTQTDKFFRP